MATTTKSTKSDPIFTDTTPEPAPKAVRTKLNHHAYSLTESAGVGSSSSDASFSEVVTFGTRAEAIEYALPRKWDVVSGAPGVPLTELIAQARP